MSTPGQHTPEQAVRQHPFAIFAELDAQLRAARFEAAEGQFWTGLAFRLGDSHFVAPRAEVREVLPVPPATRVPGASDWLLGLANVRGELLTLCDLRRLTGLGGTGEARNERVLVHPLTDGAVGFVVDSVIGQRRFLPGDQKHLLADDSPQPLRDWLLGGFVRDGIAWRALSLQRVAAAPTLAQAAA